MLICIWCLDEGINNENYDYKRFGPQIFVTHLDRESKTKPPSFSSSTFLSVSIIYIKWWPFYTSLLLFPIRWFCWVKQKAGGHRLVFRLCCLFCSVFGMLSSGWWRLSAMLWTKFGKDSMRKDIGFFGSIPYKTGWFLEKFGRICGECIFSNRIIFSGLQSFY